jgi:hypothetical protein
MLGLSASPRRSLAALAAIGTMLVPLLLATWSVAGPPPAFRPAHGLPGEDVPVPAVGNQDDPAIARGGNQFLVAWTDDRTSFLVPSASAGSNRDVYAARLDQDGALLDTTPIVINQAQGDQFDPTVVWNGTDWL